MEGVEITAVIQVLKSYFSPDATDQVLQDVTKFLNHKRADQTTERFLLEFDILGTKADRVIRQGFQFPDSFISILRTQSALLSKNEKSPAMAAVQGPLDYPLLAKQMRQISQLVGGPRKRDILNFPADSGGVDDEDISYEAWVAFRKAARSRKDSTHGYAPSTEEQKDQTG